MDLTSKKLLVLGGKPIGSCEIVEYAKKMGIYTIVTDYLSQEESPAKMLADEQWNISTADIIALKEQIIEKKVDGIYAGVHEFNIEKMIELCEDLKMPCFCTLQQWKTLNNKRLFKNLCKEFSIPTTKEYKLNLFSDEELSKIEYPVVIKPVDGSGSRGFSICWNGQELKAAYQQAASFSATKTVLVERYMNYEKSVIINYTLIDGEIFFSGMSDKQSKKVSDSGAPIMSVQFYPSEKLDSYVRTLNTKVKNMFTSFGLKNGVIWIEAFCDGEGFVFNEMGFRFGGSLTYLPVRELQGVDQLALQIEYALTGKNKKIEIKDYATPTEGIYCILPVHVQSGTIRKIIGLEELMASKELIEFVPVHYLGDKIADWGSAQQVFGYIHFKTYSKYDLEKYVDWILQTLKVLDENNQQMLFNLYRGK